MEYKNLPDIRGWAALRAVVEKGGVSAAAALVDVLVHGPHVSFLPRFAVVDDIAAGRPHHIKVSGFRIMRTLWIARHRNNVDHPVAEAFISVVRGA